MIGQKNLENGGAKMKLWIWTFGSIAAIAFIIAIALNFCESGTRNGFGTTAKFFGEIPDYEVRIVEISSGVCPQLDVSLDPVKRDSAIYPLAIRGYDNEPDGRFDRIMIRELESTGVNDVVFRDGKWEWRPCLEDKDKVQPFTPGLINLAQARLYEALAVVHNEDHRVKSFTSRPTRIWSVP